LLRLLPNALLIAALWSCADPARDRAIEALGPEAPGVKEGPLHRPGQPCVLCHDDAGNAPPFSVAGTVYIEADSLRPIEDVTVNLIDALGGTFSATTNCAGNFFVRPREYSLDGPIWITMQREEVFREMDTPVYRDGSCAGCHGDPIGPASAGHVFLIDDPEVEEVPVSQCP
jgi:hypothetical protein